MALFPINFLMISVNHVFLKKNCSIKYLTFLFLQASEQQAFIISNMRTIESLTAINNVRCVEFRSRQSEDPYYITIINGDGCYSYVSILQNF